MTDTQPVPEYVILALAYAREDGSCYMLDSAGVIEVIGNADNAAIEGFEDYDVDDAVEWLEENSRRYMEALRAMDEYETYGQQGNHCGHNFRGLAMHSRQCPHWNGGSC